ncbi:tRNA(Ile)-lysidine synthase [Marinibacterium anthonyi]|nr:tRNA(Ile)-lysidine synthase [Marinibacterium anthonyi]
MTLADADILAVVRGQFHASAPSKLAVAVSGGGDSMALLHILSRCFPPGAVDLLAVTVDHGLRPEAADEAAFVGRFAETLGVPHAILTWGGWDGTGNLQAAAREARYRLMGDWARSEQVALLALGHTADDQAETVLMRLARSSGVNGLSGMPVRRTMHGVSLVRPMLGLTRAQLRDYLRGHDIAWREDPSNEDPKYERIQMRAALDQLAPLGITAQALSSVATYMAAAREALDWYTFVAARDIAELDAGDVVIDLRGFRVLPEEIARRLLLRAVAWIARSDYPPRRAAVSEAIDALRHGRGATLGGCRLLVGDRAIRVCREYAAVRDRTAGPGQVWDGRWLLQGPVDQDDIRIAALGRKGLSQVPEWRETGRPYAALMASPAVWSGDDLKAAPLAGLANGWRAELHESGEAFFAALLSN